MVFLSVNKRDTVDLSVKVNYETAPSGNGFLGTAHSTLFSSFDGSFGSGVEGGVSSTSSVFNDALSGAGMANKSSSSSAPRAYLNYILFDREMNYVTAGFQQISTAALRTAPNDYEQIAINEIIADQEGYLLAYVSNENQEAVNIFFDDFTVYHGKTNVVESSDYYPFGAMFNRFERTASIPQNYKFQAMEWLPELRWYDFGPRGYDPFIVRTNSLDLLADQFPDMSPYSFLNNNPLRFTDPTGMAAEDIIEEDCCNGASGVGEGIARAAQSKVNQVSDAISGAVEAVVETVADIFTADQAGGVVVTSSSGGADPTQLTATNVTEEINADGVTNVLGGSSKSSSTFGGIAKGLNKVKGLVNEFNDGGASTDGGGDNLKLNEKPKTIDVQTVGSYGMTFRKDDGLGDNRLFRVTKVLNGDTSVTDSTGFVPLLKKKK